MKRNYKLIILDRLTTKIGCKIKKNEILEKYFKDKREELEGYKPKTRLQYIFWKVWRELLELVKL